MSLPDKQSFKWVTLLRGAHDLITAIGHYVAVLCLAIIVISYCTEIVSRYFLASPTQWASSMVAYMLCAMLFLITPALVRDKAQILISILPDSLSASSATTYMRVVYLLCAVVCMIAGWFCFDVAVKQFVSNISTVNEWRIPKWWLSSLLPYGFFSSGLYFLRHSLSSEPYKVSEVSIS